MRISLCSQQRNREPYIEEWIRFHHSQGIDHFYLYIHQSTDGTLDLVKSLSKQFSIDCYQVSNLYQSQLRSFQHCLNRHGHEFDWCGFIDGDEFLFHSSGQSIGSYMSQFTYRPISALAVYWVVFGSSHHINEPKGSLIENFRWRSRLDHRVNRHFKSLVRGHQGCHVAVSNCSHYFHSIMGTEDCLGRRIEQGQWMDIGHIISPHSADHSQLRINHYATQSQQYFLTVKQHQGSADQLGIEQRSQSWYTEYDRNEEWDTSLEWFSSAGLNTLSSQGENHVNDQHMGNQQ